MKIKGKTGAKGGNGKKPSLLAGPKRAFLKYKKVWILAFSGILLICLGWYLSDTWLIRAYSSQAKTYSKVSVLGVSVGDLDASQLSDKLAQLKTEFEAREITLTNAADKWTFDSSKLGATIDVPATSQKIWQLNGTTLAEKYRLLTGSTNPLVSPVVLLDSKKCIETLSTITTLQIEPKDAFFSFDQGISIVSEQAGTKISADSTCQALLEALTAGLFSTKISLDSITANITKADLEPKLAQVQSLAGESLSLKSGSYQLTLTPEELLALLEVTKKDAGVQVDWSSAKLDNLVNNIAAKVNTSDSQPALGTCQYLVSTGGNRLDREATKKIFANLASNNARVYSLPVTHQASVIGTRKPVTAGSNGTVYLTFDDGMLYGNQIMNYAACYGVKITFFEIGSRADIDATALRRAIAEGHAVQSHGYEHAMYDYGDRSYDWQFNDLQHSVNAIMAQTGVRPTYFRPPGGNRSANTYTAAAANGLKVILWGVSSADTAGIGSQSICSNVLAGVFPGASVLMHSTKQTTTEAVPCIIEGLAARGYSMQALR